MSGDHYAGAASAAQSSDGGVGRERNGECESEAKRKRRELEQVENDGEEEEEETEVDDEHINNKKKRRYATSDDGARLEAEDEAEEGPGARAVDEEVVNGIMPSFVGKRSQVLLALFFSAADDVDTSLTVCVVSGMHS